MWQAEQSPELEPLDLDDEGISFGPTNEGHGYAARYFHELLIRDPPQAAIELDDDRLARLPELGAREPSLTLAELLKTYRNKRPPLSPSWNRKAKLFWSEFAKIVKVETVRDITPDDIARYGDKILDRGKTGVPRIAVLWKRTVAAIRTYLAESGHQSPSLFVSQTGAPYNGNHIGRNFRRRRSAAVLPESVEFARIRDGSYTAAVESGVDALQAAMIAGHSNGMKDHYVKRGPGMVADACAAIERHFFGE